MEYKQENYAFCDSTQANYLSGYYFHHYIQGNSRQQLHWISAQDPTLFMLWNIRTLLCVFQKQHLMLSPWRIRNNSHGSDCLTVLKNSNCLIV